MLHQQLPRRRFLGLVCVAAVYPSIAAAQAGPHYYRYELITRSQDFTYVGEAPAGASGARYAVETDELGRVTRTAVMRLGREVSARVYVFASGAKQSTGYETYTGSEKTGHVAIQRNAAGDRIREDSFTVDGVATGHIVNSYSADSVEVTSYTADGKVRGVNVSYYSPQGILTRSINYSNADDRSFHVDSDFDDRTGLRKGSSQYESGMLSNSVLYDYDDDGDLIRQEVFDPAGHWFAATEVVNGLTTKRVYDSSKELRYTYDRDRRVKETTLFYNMMFVCRFTYDRLPDGTPTRTLAFGPDGALWAEYPDMEIVDVRQNGRPINGRPAIIKKTGDWY